MDEFIDRRDTNAEKYQLRQKLFGTDEVLPMWVADMDLSSPECVLSAVNQRLRHPIIGYEIMSDAAYHAQISWVHRHHDFLMEREWLSYSPSVVASIGCAIRAFSEMGDEVIVMDPVYPPFYEMVKRNGRKLILHPLRTDAEGKYRFDLQRLSKQITPKTKLLLFCSPHNPVGRVWSRDELNALGKFCLDNGIRIISDEIHCDLVFTPYKHIPFASLSPEVLENTITLLGPGKTFNMAGFSISTVSIASSQLRQWYEDERNRLHWGDGAALSHVAFEAAYMHGESWYCELMEHLERNRTTLSAWMEKEGILTCHRSEATYLAWIDCRSLGLGDRELREFFIRKAGLGLSPGLSFGKEGSGFMRLNFAVSSHVLDEALMQLSKALHG